MNIPEGFTPRGDSNEQPPETYGKAVWVIRERYDGATNGIMDAWKANFLPWKIPQGPLRILAYKVLP